MAAKHLNHILPAPLNPLTRLCKLQAGMPSKILRAVYLNIHCLHTIAYVILLHALITWMMLLGQHSAKHGQGPHLHPFWLSES